MSGRRELTWLQRLFIRVTRWLADQSIGYYIDFDEELVRQHGIIGFFKWSKSTAAATNALEQGFGSERMHLVAGFASFFNGCDYCAWGHLFALNLEYFKRTGQLYPIDEVEVLELMQRGDASVMEELERRLAGEPDHLRLIKRQAVVRDAPPGMALNDEDKLLVKSVALFEWINECSIVVNAPAPPMGRIARQKDLIARYREARAPGRAQRDAAKANPSAQPA